MRSKSEYGLTERPRKEQVRSGSSAEFSYLSGEQLHYVQNDQKKERAK